MIDELQISNLALIKEATLIPSKGLTALTGETGAGKTALLSAMKLLMGERVDKSMIRDGAEEMQVAGRLIMGNMSDADPDDELVAVRRVSQDGRSRVTLNGRMASMAELSDALAGRVDLCSQNENQQLTKPATHVDLLDAWIGADARNALQAYREQHVLKCEAEEELRKVREAGALGQARLDDARFTLRRIDDINPQEGEYEELQQTLRVAEHAEALAMTAGGAYELLVGEGGAQEKIAHALNLLESSAQYDGKLGEMARVLREAETLVEDTAGEARAYRDSIDFDPETLAAQQERLYALQGLMRAYGPRMEDVFAARKAAADLVSLVDDADLRMEEARRAYDRAMEGLRNAAGVLHGIREASAPEFGRQVTAQMSRLEMGSALLECQVVLLPEEKWTSAGPDAVEFLFKPGAGMTSRPLAKIASGGEISRVMLALKVVLGNNDSVETLVFDEIDAGVGGATALALAEVLADLAKTHQVIVVTHLAQVAVKGDIHYKVIKEAGDVPQTHLEKLGAEAREQEIARMLGGSITEASLTHARELLKQQKEPRK